MTLILWLLQAEWSDRVFGPPSERGPIGPLRHLQLEAQEAIEKPDDLEEFADLLLLVLDATRRAGFGFFRLLWAAYKKHFKNRRRSWAALPEDDQPILHERGHHD